MRMLLSSLAIGLLAAVCTATVGAEAKPAVVTQSGIGTVKLALTASQYAALLHEQPFVTTYPAGTTRLLFSGSELAIFLDRSGRGIRITTAAAEYRLGKGLGPCGTLSALEHARHLTPLAIKGPFGASGVVYRDGHLWFTLSDGAHIGSVTLSATRPSLRTLLGEAQCGVGDEQGE
jgi:hypothetical protein